jgi:hypothetical protein
LLLHLPSDMRDFQHHAGPPELVIVVRELVHRRREVGGGGLVERSTKKTRCAKIHWAWRRRHAGAGGRAARRPCPARHWPLVASAATPPTPSTPEARPPRHLPPSCSLAGSSCSWREMPPCFVGRDCCSPRPARGPAYRPLRPAIKKALGVRHIQKEIFPNPHYSTLHGDLSFTF